MSGKQLSRLFLQNPCNQIACSTSRSSYFQMRFQHSLKSKSSGSNNKKPSIWRKIGLWSAAGAGVLGFIFYVKNEKEMGKKMKLDDHGSWISVSND